ncbi:MAG: endonuclease III domain-containing protein, partial [Dethiobacteria bacterium]
SAFNKPALAVDTHVYRVSKRLGLADGNNVELVEEQLKRIIPVDQWSSFHHHLITHGRLICIARGPRCVRCFLISLCSYASEGGMNSVLEKVKK